MRILCKAVNHNKSDSELTVVRIQIGKLFSIRRDFVFITSEISQEIFTAFAQSLYQKRIISQCKCKATILTLIEGHFLQL